VNRQIGVADSKYVVLDDSLPPDHMTQRMRIANFVVKMAHLPTLLSSITQQWIKLEG